MFIITHQLVCWDSNQQNYDEQTIKQNSKASSPVFTKLGMEEYTEQRIPSAVHPSVSHTNTSWHRFCSCNVWIKSVWTFDLSFKASLQKTINSNHILHEVIGNIKVSEKRNHKTKTNRKNSFEKSLFTGKQTLHTQTINKSTSKNTKEIIGHNFDPMNEKTQQKTKTNKTNHNTLSCFGKRHDRRKRKKKKKRERENIVQIKERNKKKRK